MIAALVSLRVFAIECDHDDGEDTFSLIMEASDRAPHLEYLARDCNDGKQHLKRVDGKWVICDEEEFPSFE